MAGPMPNLMPGYNSVSASANRCADVCQKVCLASSSSHLCNFSVLSSVIGRDKSRTSPLTVAANTSAANRGLMLSAICKAVVPA